MTEILLFEEHRPPCLAEVKKYFAIKKLNIKEAEHFYLFYELKQWKGRKGQLLHNWKVLAANWIASALRD